MPSDELDLVLPGQYFSTLIARYAHLRSYLKLHMHIDIYTPIICLGPPSVTSIRLWGGACTEVFSESPRDSDVQSG